MTTKSVSNERQVREGAVTAVEIPRDRRCLDHANWHRPMADLQREKKLEGQVVLRQAICTKS